MRGSRARRGAVALGVVLVLSACSGSDEPADSPTGSPGATVTVDPGSAIEGETVALDLISVVAPDGWEVRETSKKDGFVDVVRVPAVGDDDGKRDVPTVMTWRFQAYENHVDSDRGAADHARMLTDNLIEVPGNEDLGAIEIDGVVMLKVKTGNDRYEYHGQTEPDADNDFISYAFWLEGVPDGGEAAAERLLEGIRFSY